MKLRSAGCDDLLAGAQVEAADGRLARWRWRVCRAAYVLAARIMRAVLG